MRITIISRHRERTLRQERHVNILPLEKLLEIAVDEGHGKKLLEIVLKKMSVERLTDVFETV